MVEVKIDDKDWKELKKMKDDCKCDSQKGWKGRGSGSGGDAVYGIGLIGALFFYLGHATSFGTVVMGILKSLVWPAMMVYHLFGFLKM
jgi:hypothetical protein